MSAELVLGVQLALALAGAALWAHESRARAAGSPRARRVRGAALAALGVLGLAAYPGFGRLHAGRALHIWDSYHYYLGAKYFAELGYDGLYECTALADAEAGLRHDVATRTITDLHTNLQIKTFDVLIHPERCTDRFAAPRWAAFQRDVAWFRARVERETWHRMQRDHGYNATPVWHLLGAQLANLGPASELQLGCLAAIDPLLLLLTLGLVAWAFGWRTAALAALVLGTCYPARFYWTGGAFLRMDWLCAMVAGLCFLRKDRPLAGGAALAYAAMLRLFPAALFAGPALAAASQLWRTRRLSPSLRRLFAGAALAAALLLPPALLVAGDGGRAFVDNTRKHADTPLTNHMGLPALLAYRPDGTVRALSAQREHHRRTLWPRFMDARRAAARQELWRSAALSLCLVPALLALTCYYYAFAVALAVLAERRPAVGAALLVWCASSLALALGLEPRVGMDEAYVAQSALAVLGMIAVVALALRRAPGAPGAPAGELTTRTS